VTVWPLQEARERLNELIEDANSKGPQIVTWYGVKRAVILATVHFPVASGGLPSQEIERRDSWLIGNSNSNSVYASSSNSV
jgi:prevent-host-death family protein